MGSMYDEMEKHEALKNGGYVDAKFTKEENGNIGISCDVAASGDEIRALIGSLATKVCEAEKRSIVEFFAEMVIMTTLQNDNKKDEE